MTKNISGLLVLILIVIIWEVSSRLQLINPTYFPPFSKVVLTLIPLMQAGNTWVNIMSTLIRCFTGYAIACLIGIPLGIIMGKSKIAFRLLNMTVELLRPIPSAAVIPIAILLFGIDNAMKIFVISYACIWPVLVNSIDGVKNIDPILIETGKSFYLSKNRFIGKIIIPASLPQIITGMRISLAISLILSITVEMIAGNNGLGFFILDSERSFAFNEMYAGIVLIGIIGYLINMLFVIIADKLVGWHRGYTKMTA